MEYTVFKQGNGIWKIYCKSSEVYNKMIEFMDKEELNYSRFPNEENTLHINNYESYKKFTSKFKA